MDYSVAGVTKPLDEADRRAKGRRVQRLQERSTELTSNLYENIYDSSPMPYSRLFLGTAPHHVSNPVIEKLVAVKLQCAV